MTAYTLHAVNIHYVTYTVHAATVEDAIAIFNDQDMVENLADFDTLYRNTTLFRATLDDGSDVFGAVTA
jgi:hypothetical protein